MTVQPELYRGSLLDPDVDVIVNAANSSLMGGGGVDGVIHRAAGPRLKAACRPLAPCPPGEVRVTEGFGLAPRLVFHTVGPVWQGGGAGESGTLTACYRNCLDALVERGLRSIAFPAISTGAYGYPADLAAEVAVSTASNFPAPEEIKVVFAAIDDRTADAIARALRVAGARNAPRGTG